MAIRTRSTSHPDSDITRLINICLHGLDKTRDYMHRALRGVIYQGAPTPEDIAAGAHPDWFWPAEPRKDETAGSRS